MGVGKKPSDNLYEKIAAEHGVPVDEVVSEMQNLIDATWNNPDPTAREKQQALFPNGKPSIEEFIRVVAKHSRQQ